ncbi:MAG: prepilin-type N-terminal cleavage/methylation domain-containing protein [Sedimentisphaerales bacterium]|nr:prepilin-type N-terminal cleavage/methylation domain-containing protein [Sedimentisphaerales bacterium]
MAASIRKSKNAFTITEVLAVVVILAIAAIIVPVMATNTNGMQIRSAGEQLLALITYAQNNSIALQRQVQIVYDANANSFTACDADGEPLTGNPNTPDGVYRVTFGDDTPCPNVTINSVDFDETESLWFDRLGAPHGGDLGEEPLPLLTGDIVIAAGDEILTVTVHPFTGQITVN